jgi:hypothetical protein
MADCQVWVCEGGRVGCRPGNPCHPDDHWTSFDTASGRESVYVPLDGSPSVGLRRSRKGRRRPLLPHAAGAGPSLLAFAVFANVGLLLAAALALTYGRAFGPLEWFVVLAATVHLIYLATTTH